MNAKDVSNDVIGAFGGVRWRPMTEAIEAIRRATGCDENDAIRALRVWVSDRRVSVRAPCNGALALQEHYPTDHRLVQFSLPLIPIDMHELRALLTRSESQPTPEPAELVQYRDLTAEVVDNAVVPSKPKLNVILLKDFLKKTATREHTKPELRELADQAFPGHHITNLLFEKAYKALPADQKRKKGDTERTIMKRG
jgi:hypothetical protein